MTRGGAQVGGGALRRGAFAALFLAASALAAAAQSAPAADPPPRPERTWAVDAGVEAASRYLFRGVSLLGDQRILEPHARFGIGGFAVSAWGFFGKLPGGHDAYREADLSADYTFFLGDRLALTLGAVTYQFGSDAERELDFLDTYELYTVIALDVPFSPTLTYYHDVDQVKGGFATLSFLHVESLGARASVRFTGSIGADVHYNNRAVSRGTWNDVLLGVEVPLRVTDSLVARAGIQRSTALRALDRLRAAGQGGKAFYGDQTILTAGVSYFF